MSLYRLKISHFVTKMLIIKCKGKKTVFLSFGVKKYEAHFMPRLSSNNVIYD